MISKDGCLRRNRQCSQARDADATRRESLNAWHNFQGGQCGDKHDSGDDTAKDEHGKPEHSGFFLIFDTVGASKCRGEEQEKPSETGEGILDHLRVTTFPSLVCGHVLSAQFFVGAE